MTTKDQISSGVTTVGQTIACALGGKAVSRVRYSLALCCEAFTESAWPEMVWRFSGLTTDGSPVEFTFSSADNFLRYTTDVAPPEVQHRERIAAACDLAAQLDHPSLDAERMLRWRALQEGHTLRWGARLGVRHTGEQEKIKYYVEVPFESQHKIRSEMSPPLSESVAVMVGCEPQARMTEYYFRQQQLSLSELDRLLGMLGSASERSAMLDGIEHLCGMPIASALQWTYFGYSIVSSIGEQEAAKLTLFARCPAVGGARRARQRMLQWMRPAVREQSLYYRLLIDQQEADLPDHGVISLSLSEPSATEIRVGLSGTAMSRLLELSIVAGDNRDCASC